jgi:putative SbcD/Mre11-related phosphoesterase
MLNPTAWLFTPERVLLHRPSRTAIVADLHLGYDEARRRGGEAVPQRSLDATLAPLGAVLRRTGVRRLVIAGDLFEARYRVETVAQFRHWLQGKGVELTAVVPGNHDRGIDQADDLPLYPAGFPLGDWLVVHGHDGVPEGRVVLGHWHPCLRWQGRTAAPCYLMGPRSLLLPAYSVDAAGVNILGRRAWRDYRCWAIAGDQVFELGPLARIPKRIQD